MQCSKCGQGVPANAIHCPHCVAEPKTTDQEAIRGGIRGGLVGFVIGLLPMLWVLEHFGAERGIKAIVFAVPIATFTTGLMIGLVKAKRDWK